MRLSQGVEWALHCCYSLAEIPAGATLTLAQLAELHAAGAPYLAKHLQALSRAGIVEAVTGPNGGYRLARPADQISLLEVVEAIEGRANAFRCTEIRQRGPAALPADAYRLPCAIAEAMYAAEAAWRAELAGRSIAGITEAARSRDPQAVARTCQWLADSIARRNPAARRTPGDS